MSSTNVANRWRAVKGYKGLYEVTDRDGGQVRSLYRVVVYQQASYFDGVKKVKSVSRTVKKGRMLKQNQGTVKLYRNGTCETRKVQDLVREVFGVKACN